MEERGRIFPAGGKTLAYVVPVTEILGEDSNTDKGRCRHEYEHGQGHVQAQVRTRERAQPDKDNENRNDQQSRQTYLVQMLDLFGG